MLVCPAVGRPIPMGSQLYYMYASTCTAADFRCVLPRWPFVFYLPPLRIQFPHTLRITAAAAPPTSLLCINSIFPRQRSISRSPKFVLLAGIQTCRHGAASDSSAPIIRMPFVDMFPLLSTCCGPCHDVTRCRPATRNHKCATSDVPNTLDTSAPATLP
jgi:hypothetical protein